MAPLNEAALDRYIASAMPTTSLFDRYERECAAAHAKHGDELPKDVSKALQSLYIAAYCENRDSLKGEEKEYFLLKEREFSLDTEDKARLRELHYKFYGLKPETVPAVSSLVSFDGRAIVKEAA